jgi:hypothetical protein
LFRNPEEGQGSQRAVVPVMIMMMMMMMMMMMEEMPLLRLHAVVTVWHSLH